MPIVTSSFNLSKDEKKETMSEKPKYSIRLSKAAKEFNVSETTIKEFLARKGFQIYQLPKMKLTTDMYALLVREYCFSIRLSKVAKEFNVGVSTIRESLAKKGFQVDSSPNAKLTAEMYELLVKEFQGEKAVKEGAKKLGNLSYKGGCISIESTFENDIEKSKNKEKKGLERTILHQEPTNEENEVEKEILIPLSKLSFGSNYISIKHGSLGFYLFASGISTLLNSEKSLNDISTSILLNYPNHTFQFLDSSILSNLKEMSALLKKVKETEQLQKQMENFQKQIKKEKEKKERKRIVETRVKFSKLQFGQGQVSILYGGKRYIYLDQRIKDYNKTLKLIYCNSSCSPKYVDRTRPVRVAFDNEGSGFSGKKYAPPVDLE